MHRLGAALACFITACSSGLCSATELERALAAAHDGDSVSVGACEIAGAFVVPNGVTLHGSGAATVLRSIEGGAPVIAEPEAGELQVGASAIAR